MQVSVSTALPDAAMLCSCSMAAALSCPAIINLMLSASIPCLKTAASRTLARRSIPQVHPARTLEPAKQTHVALLPPGRANTASHGHSPQGWHSKCPGGQHSQSWGLEMLCLLPIHLASQILPRDTPTQPRLEGSWEHCAVLPPSRSRSRWQLISSLKCKNCPPLKVVRAERIKAKE